MYRYTFPFSLQSPIFVMSTMSNKSSVVPNKSGCGEEDVKELEKDTSLIDFFIKYRFGARYR